MFSVGGGVLKFKKIHEDNAHFSIPIQNIFAKSIGIISVREQDLFLRMTHVTRFNLDGESHKNSLYNLCY